MLGVTPTSGDYPFIPVFARKAGLDLSKVNMVQVDGNVRSRLLTERKVDAIDGYAVSNLPFFAATDVKTRFMLFSSYGMNFPGIGLITQQALAKSDPKLCTAMAVGLLKGLRDCMTDLDGSLQLFLNAVPEIAVSETARKQSRIGMGIFNVSMLSDVPKKHGFGYAQPEDQEATIDLTMEYAADKGDTRPKASDIFTNDFIGDVKMDDVAWKKAEASLAEFVSYVRRRRTVSDTYVSVVNVSKVFETRHDIVAAVSGVKFCRGAGRVRRHPRPERLRQEHYADDVRRARERDLGPHRDGGNAAGRPARKHRPDVSGPDAAAVEIRS